MTRLIADQNQGIFKYESGTFGNASGAAQWPGYIQNHDIVEKEGIFSIRYAGTASRDVSQQLPGPIDNEGTIKFYPMDWRMLFFALGSVSETGLGPYTHNISATNNNVGNAWTSGAKLPFVSFTFEDGQQTPATSSTNLIRTVNGCNVDKYNFDVKQGAIVDAEVQYIGQSVSYTTGLVSSITAPGSRPFLWSDAKLSSPSGTFMDSVLEFKFSVDNKLVKPHYINGSRVIDVPVPTSRTYAVELTVHGDATTSKTFYDQYYHGAGGSPFNMLLEVTDATAGAGSRQMFLSLSGCAVKAFDGPSPAEGVNEQKYTIEPKTVSAVVIDTLAKYGAF